MSCASKARGAALGLLVSFVVPAAHAANCNAGDEVQLNACITGAGNGDTITLTANIPLTAALDPVNVDVSLVNGAFTLGPGGLSVSGTGTLRLPAANALTGGNNFDGPTVVAGASTAIALGNITLANGGRFVAASSMTLTNQILYFSLGGGTFSASPGTTLRFSGFSISLGGTGDSNFNDPLNNGVLEIGPTGSATTTGAAVVVLANGTWRTVTNNLGNRLPANAVSFTVAAGATFDNGGFSLNGGFPELLGGGTIALSGGYQLLIGNGNFTGSINGDGGLRTSGAVRLSGTNGYTGATTILASSTLTLGNGGGTGSLATSAITNDGSLVLDRNNAFTLAMPISGAGSLTKLGAGYVTLSANNSYAGVTTISAGVLSAGSGGATGTVGNGNVTNNSLLVIDRNNEYIVNNSISGTGSLAISGGGTTRLRGNNTFLGATTVGGNSTLAPENFTAGFGVIVLSGATLSGTGFVMAPVNAQPGGRIVSAGPMPGIQTIGSLTMAAGVQFDSQINGALAGTLYDVLAVQGTVNLNGATLNLSLGFAPTLGDSFRIIDNDGADAVAGTFNGLPEGATFIVGSYLWQITYQGNTGNDVNVVAIAALPGAPTIVSAVSGNASATVTWNAAAANGSPILDYELTCGAVVVNPAVSPQLVTGLANGVAVDCTVRGRSALGYGPASAPMSVTPSFRTFTGPSAAGSGMITASFSGGGATCSFAPTPEFIPLEGHAKSPPAGSLPASTTVPHGLFDFTTVGCTPGTAITMTITYPSPVDGLRYYKYGPTPGNAVPHWYVLAATFAGSTATFDITDGGLGDDDLTANGTIVDQGGPVGSGLETRIPTMDRWALLLMALLIGAFALGHIGRGAVRR